MILEEVDFFTEEIENLNEMIKINSLKNKLALKYFLTFDILDKLASDESRKIRELIAQREDLPKEITKKIANDTDVYVRKELANNQFLQDEEVINMLSNDKDKLVRESLAKNKNLNQKLILKLSNDEDYSVRSSIANRNDISDDLIIKLAGDRHSSVRSAIVVRENLPYEAYIKLYEKGEGKGIIYKQKLPIEIIEKIVKDHDIDLWKRLAIREDLPEKIIERIRVPATVENIDRIKSFWLNIEEKNIEELDRAAFEYYMGFAIWGGTKNFPENIEKSYTLYKRIIEKDPNYEKAWDYLISSKFIDFVYKDLEWLEIEIFPKIKSIKILQRITPIYGSKKRYDKVIPILEKIIEIDHNNEWAYNNLIYLHIKSSRFKEAIEIGLKAISLFPKDPILLNNTGFAFGKLENYKKTIDICSKAIELDPSSPHPYDCVAWAYKNLKNYPKALENYKKSIILDDKDAEYWYGLLIIYHLSGDFNSARKVLKRINILGTENIEDFDALEFKNIYKQLTEVKSDIKISQDPKVRASLAMSSELKPKLIEILADDTELEVRLQIARRNDLSDEITSKLAKDDALEIRYEIATKSILPDTVIEILSKDENREIRKAIASIPNLSISIIERFIEDEADIKELMTKQKNLDDKNLIILASDKNPKIRRMIASFPDLNAEIIDMLANDEDEIVRLKISKRVYLPLNIIKTLSTDPNIEIRRNIALSNNITDDLVQVYLKDFDKVKEKIRYPVGLIKDDYRYLENDHFLLIKWIQPLNDKSLMDEGVNFGIYVEIKNDEILEKYITIKSNRRNSTISCIKTIFNREKYEHPINLGREEEWLEVFNEFNPYDHYFAMKSFIHGMIEIGIENFYKTREWKERFQNPSKQLMSSILNALVEVTLHDIEWDNDNLIKPKLKVDWLKNLFDEEAMKIAIIKQTILSDETLYNLIESKNLDVKRAISERKDIPIDIINRLITEMDGKIITNLGMRGDLPEEVMTKVLKYNHKSSINLDYYDIKDFKEYISKHENLSDEFMQMLLGKAEEYEMYKNIILRKNLSDEMIKFILNSKEIRYRRILAERIDLTQETMLKLASDEENSVKESLATHKNLPPKVLEILIESDEYHVLEPIIEGIDEGQITDDVLKELARSKSAKVREFIASRYRLSDEVLKILIKDNNLRVREVVAKKIVDYKDLSTELIEDYIYDMDEKSRYKIAKRNNLSEELIRKLADDYDDSIRKLIAEKKDLPQDVIKSLAADSNKEVRAFIACQDNLPQDILEILSRDDDVIIKFILVLRKYLNEDEKYELLNKIREGYSAKREQLKHENRRMFSRYFVLNQIDDGFYYNIFHFLHDLSSIPPELEEELLKLNHRFIYQNLAEIKALKADLSLDELKLNARSEFGNVRVFTARKSDLPDEVIRILADDKSEVIRKMIAEKPLLPDDVIKKFACDPNYEVRMAMTQRKDLTIEAIESLSGDYDEIVEELIQNEDLPENILKKLANHENEKIRRSVANHPKLTKELLMKLLKDESGRVRQTIASRDELNLEIVNKLIMEDKEELFHELASRTDLTMEMKKKLSKSRSNYAREKIAKQEELSEEIIELLANDPDRDVREVIAERTDLPQKILDKLSQDEEYWVRKHICDKKISLESINRLADDEESYVREGIAKRNDLPMNLIRKLAEDPESNVRCEIAKNEKLPLDLIKKLAFDDDKRVKKAIRARKGLPEDIKEVMGYIY